MERSLLGTAWRVFLLFQQDSTSSWFRIFTQAQLKICAGVLCARVNFAIARRTLGYTLISLGHPLTPGLCALLPEPASPRSPHLHRAGPCVRHRKLNPAEPRRALHMRNAERPATSGRPGTWRGVTSVANLQRHFLTPPLGIQCPPSGSRVREEGGPAGTGKSR